MLDHTLGRLETIELIRRLYESDASYLFKHALVQDTAYYSLLRHERRRLHRLIGETLEREYPDALDENAARLAQHFFQAGDNAKALEYGTRAGDIAARVFAKTDALQHSGAAFDAAIQLNAEGETLIALATKLGRIYELQNDYTRALETYNSLNTMAQERSDLHLELAALMLQATVRATPTPVFEPRIGQDICDRALVLARALNDGGAEAKILWNLLLLNAFQGRYAATVAYGEQSLTLARQLNLTTQIAYTLNDLGIYGYFSTAQHARARAAMAEARAMWRTLDIVPMLADNLNNSGILEYIYGDYMQAQAFYTEGLQHSERLGNIWGLSLGHSFMGVIKADTGDFGGGLAEMEQACTLAHELNSGITLVAATNLAIHYAMVGDIENGSRLIQIARRDIDIPLYRAPAKAALAYLTFLQGDIVNANVLLSEADPRTAEEFDYSYLPGILARGEIGLARGQAAEVIAYTETIKARLLSFGIHNFIADADLYRGRALMQLEQWPQAHAAFEQAYASATEIDSQRALAQIYNYWSQLERAQNNFVRADELAAQAREQFTAMANTLPQPRREIFLQWNRVP